MKFTSNEACLPKAAQLGYNSLKKKKHKLPVLVGNIGGNYEPRFKRQRAALGLINYASKYMASFKAELSFSAVLLDCKKYCDSP